MKRSCAAFVVLAAVLLASTLFGGAGPDRASACSFLPGLSRLALAEITTPVVAVGVVTKATETVATFRVEEGMRGARAGDVLSINNALNLDCYEEVGGGPNYAVGTRYLAFLQPDNFKLARWKPEMAGRAMYTLQGDELTNFRDEQPYTPLDAALAELRTLPSDAIPGYDPERTCEQFEVHDFATALKAARWATSIVRGEVGSVRDHVARVTVTESFKGPLRRDDDLSVDARGTVRSGICSIEFMPEFDRFLPADDLILLLVPANGGFGEWRLAVWGSGLLAVSGTRVQTYPGMATLSQVRAALVGKPSAPLPRAVPNVLASPNDGGNHRPGPLGAGLEEGDVGSSSWPLVLGLCALGVVAIAAWTSSRASDRRRTR